MPSSKKRKITKSDTNSSTTPSTQSTSLPSKPSKAPTDIEPTTTSHTLDPNADVLLILPNTTTTPTNTLRVLVQSKTLRLTSPVFSTLFFSPFAEGTELARTGHVDITLPDDDTHAMLTILRILHFKCDDVREDYGVVEVARLAVHAHKYDCITALQPWIQGWEQSFVFGEGDVTENLWLDFVVPALVACHLFKRRERFADLLTRGFKHLKEKECVSETWENHLPDGLLDAVFDAAQTLRVYIAVALGQLFTKIHNSGTKVYKLIPTEYISVDCHNHKMSGRYGCNRCGSASETEKKCHLNSRIRDCYHMLWTADIWPTICITCIPLPGHNGDDMRGLHH